MFLGSDSRADPGTYFYTLNNPRKVHMLLEGYIGV